MQDISNKPSTPLGPDKGYVEMLDEALLKIEEEKAVQGRAYNPLRPSAAGYCARKLAYQNQEWLKLAPYTAEFKKPSVLRLLNLGHFIESHIIQEFRKIKGLELKYMQQILGFLEYDDGELAEGSMDMGMKAAGFNGGAADAKSKGDKFSGYMGSKWDQDSESYGKMNSVERVNELFFKIPDLDAFLEELRDPFFKANFYQLNVYVNSPFLQDRGYDHASVIQYNKNDSRMREFRFKPSKKAYEYVKDKFRRIKANAATPEVIEKEHTIGSMSCSFCEYAKRCWPEVDTKKAFYETLPSKNWPKDTRYLGETGVALERMYNLYKSAESIAESKDTLAEDMVALMRQEQVELVKFNDGATYTIKFLKTPRPHYELRRTKA